MAILDRQGRLFGKVSILDVGAIAVILLAGVGLFLVPNNSGTSIAQIVSADIKPVEVQIMVKGLTVADAENLIKEGESANITIRNQPRGRVAIKTVKILTPRVVVPKFDGTVTTVPDPRLTEIYSRDFAITLEGKAKVTDDGVIFGSEKVKVGTPVEIESAKYVMRGSVMSVKY
jgi:Domain of unknown function (DUF4330)